MATKKALVAAAQINVIEFHTWNARVSRIVRKMDQPDRVIFDLDPGEGERWERVQEAATLVRGLLQELGLQSWLKTSGGKGRRASTCHSSRPTPGRATGPASRRWRRRSRPWA